MIPANVLDALCAIPAQDNADPRRRAIVEAHAHFDAEFAAAVRERDEQTMQGVPVNYAPLCERINRATRAYVDVANTNNGGLAIDKIILAQAWALEALHTSQMRRERMTQRTLDASAEAATLADITLANEKAVSAAWDAYHRPSRKVGG